MVRPWPATAAAIAPTREDLVGTRRRRGTRFGLEVGRHTCILLAMRNYRVTLLDALALLMGIVVVVLLASVALVLPIALEVLVLLTTDGQR